MTRAIINTHNRIALPNPKQTRAALPVPALSGALLAIAPAQNTRAF